MTGNGLCIMCIQIFGSPPHGIEVLRLPNRITSFHLCFLVKLPCNVIEVEVGTGGLHDAMEIW
jgi:hypothetical protein